MLTYISSVLLYVFGVNPGKKDIRIQENPTPPPQQKPQTPPPRK